MPPWLYALAFIALLLTIGWVVDRRASRARHGLIRAASLGFGGPARRADRAVGTAERIRPGMANRPGWHQPGAGRTP